MQTGENKQQHMVEGRLLRIYGIVQGVGFRPFVKRTADACEIYGSVCNRGPYVEIRAFGIPADLDRFAGSIQNNPPERAVILKLDSMPLSAEDTPASFSIIESSRTEGEIFVSPDIAICPQCEKELFDPNNRRYLHPFINCTSCGPRVTILDGMPYDRERTSMKEFPMCPKCRYEYTHPKTRRYDAQPVCCNDCGPRVYLLHPGQAVSLPVKVENLPLSETDHAAITAARRCIKEGGIVAVKGIGGFHLCCDATNETAVSLLRKRKHRPAKPLAVMMRDVDTVRRECQLGALQEKILTGHQKPILLLPKKTEEGTHPLLAPSIAPGSDTVGVMLPYAPIQLLLFRYDDGISMPDALVMTSGNASGAPICRDDESALKELGDLCDLILSHNREIRLRCDDSVMDFVKDRPYMVRRSRGYAPLPFAIKETFKGCALAVGGELKNTFCIAKNQLLYPSPYVGDMEDIRTVNALSESVTRMEHLLEAEPTVAACDLHPKYHTTAFAESLGLPLVRVQHHYAHILSCMAENDVLEEQVLGVSFDGTGYGTDGTIWGGEILLSDLDGFTRKASITPFLQAGGDAAAREGWRIAAGCLYGITKEKERILQLAQALSLGDRTAILAQMAMADHRLNTVTSTSAGRLFDAASAVLGIRRISTFEGEASMALETAAERWAKAHPEDMAENLPLPDTAGWRRAEEGRLLLPTNDLFSDLVRRRLSGEETGSLALFFHTSLSLQITAALCAIREETGISHAALSGGVFQNRLLLVLTRKALKREGFTVYTHRMVPANDGGIALGQAAAAMRALQKGNV